MLIKCINVRPQGFTEVTFPGGHVYRFQPRRDLGVEDAICSVPIPEHQERLLSIRASYVPYIDKKGEPIRMSDLEAAAPERDIAPPKVEPKVEPEPLKSEPEPEPSVAAEEDSRDADDEPSDDSGPSAFPTDDEIDGMAREELVAAYTRLNDNRPPRANAADQTLRKGLKTLVKAHSKASKTND